MTNAGMNPALHGAVDLSGLVRRHSQPSPASAAAAGGAGNSGVSRVVDDRGVGEVVELSRRVPVILEIIGGELKPSLQELVEGYGGRFAYAEVRAEDAPELVQALQLPGIPVVLALVGGQPIPLFQGIPPEADIVPILDQVLELAAKNGVTGVVETEEKPVQDVEDELPPAHQEAYEALSRNDTAAAKAAFSKALAENPKDVDAQAGLLQVELLERVTGVDQAHARAQAAGEPDDPHLALVVADLDVIGGHVADAFHRLLSLYPRLDDGGKELLRNRLLDYFVVAGQSADEVKRARAQLSSLMF